MVRMNLAEALRLVEEKHRQEHIRIKKLMSAGTGPGKVSQLEEIKMLVLYMKGKNFTQISEALGRPANTCFAHVNKFRHKDVAFQTEMWILDVDKCKAYLQKADELGLLSKMDLEGL